jgi:phage/plasmid-like protein (TIGR03299 family)
MSHQIETAVFSSREGAGWTGLGQVIPADVAKDPRKIAELVGATFHVVKTPCFYRAADGSYRALDNREVLVRDDTGAALEVVSENRYHVDNRQPVDILEAFRDELAANRMEISHAAVLRGGSQIAVCAYLPSSMDFTVGKSDVVKNYVTLSTGYDGKHGTKATMGNIRVVCANTLAYSIADATKTGKIETIRASTQILETTTLAALLQNVQHLVNSECKTFDALANRQMSSDEVSRYFADVLEINIADLGKYKADGKTKLISTKSENMLRELASAYSSAPGAGMAAGTAWGALNAVTYYATHVKTTRDMYSAGADATRVASNLNGDAAKLKLRALQMAAQSFAMAA